MVLPVFPEFKTLEIGDQAEVEDFFKKFPQESSDYTFANLYIWRNYDRPKISTTDGNLILLLSPEGEAPYFLPPAGENQTEKTLKACFDYLKTRPQLRRVPEKFARKYFERKLEYNFELDHDNSDYVYRVSDLVNLKGRRYDGKRNWIKKFLAKSAPEYTELVPETVPGALELLERWGKTRRGPLLKHELIAIAEALHHTEKLGLIGRGIKLNGKLSAFILGGELNPGTAIVYIQVASRDYPGLPQFFHQAYAARELKRYKYVNWEQDLGIPGLRKAKISYHPCRMVYKYDVTRL